MNNAIENTKDQLRLLLDILLFLGPYLLLFYKKIGIRIRLMFISLIEILVLCALSVIVDLGNGIFVEIAYSYELFVWAGVILNVIVIFLTWLFKTIRLGNRPKE
jgi:hypothetical protein